MIEQHQHGVRAADIPRSVEMLSSEQERSGGLSFQEASFFLHDLTSFGVG